MTLKEAIDLSLEVWRYLAKHPEIGYKANLPKTLYNKVRYMFAKCPLCEYYIRNAGSYVKVCVNCPLVYSKDGLLITCNHFGYHFELWSNSLTKDMKTRKEAATAIVRLLEAALEKEAGE